ncbi:DUF2064 domain-containing protein [Aurantibacter sp.]|uniref:TIGR04282 family arsenosugar biosynthesis glycosyltransferase n=1 Tax=Aurantibacter sp. TaxID=2807103 RepID=UPI0032649EF9
MSKNSSQSIAILIFTRSAITDAEHKSISDGEKLFDALNDHFLEVVENTGLPYIIIDDKHQKGDSFGERYSKAIESVFNQGFENIISIGNDSPRLSTEIILDAVRTLQEGNATIGPSVDGGFYLLGMHRSNFNRERFEKLSWQTQTITREVQKILEEKGRKYILLPTLFDIDCLYDLKLFISQEDDCSKNLYNIAKDIFDTTVSKYLFVDVIDERLPMLASEEKEYLKQKK